MKKFNVVYWYHSSASFDVEAETAEQAEEIIKSRIESGEIDLNGKEFSIGDDGMETSEIEL